MKTGTVQLAFSTMASLPTRQTYTHVTPGETFEHPNRRPRLPARARLNVRAELTLAETSQPEEEAASVPIDEWLSDPADAQRYDVTLRSLLGAVEALEDTSGPDDNPPSAEVSQSV